ncbi:phage portal protein [Rhodobacter capsulatus]|uniref:phage portal protein n=1 Tax=Rhodobacter capsulatus TaxID=1061 RepID=UPI0040295DD8
MAALRRARARLALGAVMRYEAATSGRRGSAWRPVGSDADTASDSARRRLAYVARDMVRNTAFAARAQQVVTAAVIGDGIIPKIIGTDAAQKAALLAAIEAHCDTVAIDADGRQNLYGLQRLAMNTIVDSGEVLIRYRARDRSDGLPLPFQLQILEPDYLDDSRDGVLPGGNMVRDGIEYDLIGRRVAYYLFTEHPGANGPRLRAPESRRVPAESVLHIYRQDRPGQMRGVSWYAPIALRLQDFADAQDAHLMRQKIAACFVGFRVSPEADPVGADPADPAGLIADKMMPGRIQNLAPGEDIKFGDPPGVNGVEDFYRWVMRGAAADIGITYEALTGDLTGVNWASYKAGHLYMERNVSSWQWLTMVTQMMQPIGRWILRDWAMVSQVLRPKVSLDWVPPPRFIVDPTREIPAMADQVRAGFTSRSEQIRRLGYDPERVRAEIEAERAEDHAAGVVFDSDAGAIAGLRAYPADAGANQGSSK